jgi:two-component system, OmpR family, response regulator
MHLLLAEDDPVLADGLQRSLRASGYAVDHVATGSDADVALSTKAFDLVILDLGLPQMSGLDVLKRMRAKRNATPVLILTAADSVEQRVRGLDLGADDYMPKPFALTELEARIRALVRRKLGAHSATIQHGKLMFDQVSRTAFVGDQAIDLSAREVGLLEILIQRSGRLVSKEQLVDHLYEWETEVSHNAIEVYIHRLRKKLEVAELKITTVRGLGYSLQKFAGPESASG